MANDTYRSTPAFAPWVQRVPEQGVALDKLRWQIFPGDELHATVFCQGQEQFEMVREQLADTHIPLTTYDKSDWSLTVKKADLKARFHNLFESRTP